MDNKILTKNEFVKKFINDKYKKRMLERKKQNAVKALKIEKCIKYNIERNRKKKYGITI